MSYQKEYHPLPQPNELSIREKEDAMGAYLMMFAALGAGLPLPILNLVAAIIYYFVHRHKSNFVRFHTLHSLYAQLPTSILNAILIFWTIRIAIWGNYFPDYYFGYLGMVILANLLYIIFSIVAAIRARNGRFYYFLLFGKLAYDQIFKVRADRGSKNEDVNLPPV